ncbi:hypothetical protein CYMTET_53545 [Cymbomonas tetramitiformis]|uniref:Uncharacterized protein n=1 Tax=Cymbomonas tetramitiformis TaxID=36881 RepID=A0AAE0EPL4_9CHLO|nr:hypothetical protein CYMTET_53545 [Cymbomonas tetramitiformis]
MIPKNFIRSSLPLHNFLLFIGIAVFILHPCEANVDVCDVDESCYKVDSDLTWSVGSDTKIAALLDSDNPAKDEAEDTCQDYCDDYCSDACKCWCEVDEEDKTATFWVQCKSSCESISGLWFLFFVLLLSIPCCWLASRQRSFNDEEKVAITAYHVQPAQVQTQMVYYTADGQRVQPVGPGFYGTAPPQGYAYAPSTAPMNAQPVTGQPVTQFASQPATAQSAANNDKSDATTASAAI